MSGVDGGGLSAEEREALDEALWGGRIYDDVPALVASIVADRDARVAAAEQRAERVTAAVRAVEASMAAQASDAWRSASARDGLADHGALVQHADAMSRWSERLRMALRGALTGDEEWLTADPAPREYDDGGPRVREAVEQAERDAEVRAAQWEAWSQAAQMARERGWLTAVAANPYRDRPRPNNPCACGSLSLDDSLSDRHDRGLHGPNECNYPTFAADTTDGGDQP